MTTHWRFRSKLLAVAGCALVSSLCMAKCSMAQPTSTKSEVPRCEILPLADQQVSFRIDGVEKLCWHYGETYPRPFFFPMNGPSGSSLTRMGHPGAPNHDHHQSVWLAHNKINGLDFWGNAQNNLVRQTQWYVYQDGMAEAIMATAAEWRTADGHTAMRHDMIAGIAPLDAGEYTLELQITLRPPPGAAVVELEQTNFGFLAVRVAKSIAAHFGGGKLSNSQGQVGEQAIFAQPAKWVDYSGPIAVGAGRDRQFRMEGITFFDHPANPRYPTHWHVRDDGWMGAAFCLQEGWFVTDDAPLTLRYLLYAHAGGYDEARAEAVHRSFSARTSFEVIPSTQPHQQFEVRRQLKN